MIKLLRYMKGYRKECVLGPFFKLLEALIELFIPYVILSMIDNGIEKSDIKNIVISVLILVLMGIVGLVFSLTAQYFSAKAAVGFTARVREVLFSHIQSLSYKEIDKIGRSTLINRMTSDMNQVQTGVNLALRLFLRSPFIVFGAAIMAYTVDPEIASVFLYTIPILSIIVFSIMLLGIPLYKKVQSHLDKITAKTRENLSGARMIRALCKENDEITDFNSVNNELSRSQRFVGKISSLMNPLTFVVINLAIVLLIYKGGVKVELGALSQAKVIVIYNYMTQILVELIKLANLIISITKAVACANRVSAVLDIKSSIEVEKSTDNASESIIEFRDVSFKYNKNGDYALKNISFSIKRGQKVGIIGGTGSGKSTLISLLCRFYDTTKGEVFVYGKNVKCLSSDELLNNVGIVPQKAALFSGTIKSNLMFGNEYASDADLYDALHMAVADEFVNDLPEGINSTVEQFGRNLSGGQKQRLTIARALVRKSNILILDDSSSALDYMTDKTLRSRISSLSYDPTVITISQRASTIKNSDVIIVLDEGEIVGMGTHDELKASCAVYNEICLSQERK